jgi:hypothetical protein
MKRYQKIMKSRFRKKLGEDYDCSVIAVSIACRVSYQRAHAMLNYYGRKNKGGAPRIATLMAAQALGFRLDLVKNLKQKNGCKFTPKTIGDKLKNGYYLCDVSGHVFAVVNGDVEDWVKDRCHRITGVWKVTRPRNGMRF